nr:MAG TPA: hypothetical protein [Caudoviricetes sp.]
MTNNIEDTITILSNQILNLLDIIDDMSNYTKTEQTQEIRQILFNTIDDMNRNMNRNIFYER